MSNHFDRPEASENASEQEAIRIDVISIKEIAAFVDSHRSTTTMILFAGDRLSCCDEGVGISLDGRLVGIATIAPHGEQDSGTPTIVGVFVDKAARNKQLGQRLFLAAVQRCQERGFSRIHVDAVSDGMKKIINHLSPEIRSLLDIQDCGNIVSDL